MQLGAVMDEFDACCWERGTVGGVIVGVWIAEPGFRATHYGMAATGCRFRGGPEVVILCVMPCVERLRLSWP